MRIGVLALQGAFIEHIKMLRALGVEAVEVRLPADLEGLDGLIIPGGESTTIGKLAVMYGLMEPLRQFAAQKPLWGTCAGMIFMAKEIGNGSAGRDQPLLGIMDVEVERNAFGRQVDSFEAGLDVSVFANGDGEPFPAVFIRAPRLVAAKGEAWVIAKLADGTAVAAQQGKWLVTSFHPELTDDLRFHKYFLSLVAEEK
ncbi:MAG: pyridoxal 5'-phosphate synthase glutaminase subunit PdxT [Ardenticatenaceae bacterium]|nr:pyridoxal 5'-phosphate synthase glutaminase subunit PdxT [Ardenticatenaceae bacterium]MCB8989958.1 pyridoxal 5'-phosphate synthase glutaminase subunit PdxT [Ardenticatenaceae bacterium]MCB9005401.1 pyridoxal 5'-phosphate synthase glutaminase subunit PdxT [Ardenticatenaceae bacterium]